MWAIVCVVLLLSMSPIDAARRQEGSGALQGEFAATDSASWGASCETLKARFETHASTMSTNVGLAQNTTGRPGYLNTASVILRAVRMTRTLQRAGNRECDWAINGEANTAPLLEIVKQTQATNPCLPRAQQLLSAESTNADEEFDTFTAAMQVLISPTCDFEVPENEPQEEDTDAAEVAEDTEGEADVLATEVMEDIEQGEGASLLQSDSPILEWIAEHSWPPPTASGSEYLAVGETVSVIEGTGPANLGAWLMHIVGAASWLVAFALLCTLAMYAILWVVSVVFCLLRFLLGLIFRRSWSLTQCVRGTMARVRNSRHGTSLMMGGCAIGGGALMASYGGTTVLSDIAVPRPFPGIPGIPGGIPR